MRPPIILSVFAAALEVYGQHVRIPTNDQTADRERSRQLDLRTDAVLKAELVDDIIVL